MPFKLAIFCLNGGPKKIDKILTMYIIAQDDKKFNNYYIKILKKTKNICLSQKVSKKSLVFLHNAQYFPFSLDTIKLL
jgi:hypothetical protein